MTNKTFFISKDLFGYCFNMVSHISHEDAKQKKQAL